MRLAFHAALVGALTPRLYGACLFTNAGVLVLTWYVAPDLTEDELEGLQVAGTEITASCTEDHFDDIEERFIEVTDRSTPLRAAGMWVLLQRGFRTTGDFTEPS